MFSWRDPGMLVAGRATLCDTRYMETTTGHMFRTDPTLGAFGGGLERRCTVCRKDKSNSTHHFGPNGYGCTCRNADDLCGQCQHQGY